MSKWNKELDDAVAALRPEMIAALQRLIRKPSVEASPPARQTLWRGRGRLFHRGADPLP